MTRSSLGSHEVTTSQEVTESSAINVPAASKLVAADPKVVLSPLSRTPIRQSMEPLGKNRKKSQLTTKRSSSHEKGFKKYSQVMVNIKQDEDSKYRFSPPHTVAMVTLAKNATPSTLSSSEYVFSPPLLRSAAKEKKIAEFRKTGVVSEVTG